ncbi:hypothetical protein N7461_002841 [Penicillium sp. DV-2018c]|nr:hypothetical protein N7461_002841 [Penicillium sp. DV-2018c]
MTDTTAYPNQDGASPSSSSYFPAQSMRKVDMTSQDFLTMYKNTYHENQESEGRPPTPTIFDRKSQDQQREYQETLKNKIKVFEYLLRVTPQPSNHTETLKSFYRFKALTSLLLCTEYIGIQDAESAEEKVKDAMATAQLTKNELLIAKCEFWHGRVEFLRGNMQRAHAHFLAAHACAMDPAEGVECMDLSFYLDVTRHGISEATRDARLLAHNKAILAEIPFDKAENNSVSVENKRKRPIWTWKHALVEMNQLPLVQQRHSSRIRKPRTPVPTRLKVSEACLAQGLEELENEDITNDNDLGNTLAEELGFESGDELDHSDTDTDTESTDESEDEAYSEEGSVKGYVCKTHNSTDQAAPDLREAAEKSQREKIPTAPVHAPTNSPPGPQPNLPHKILNDQAMCEQPKPGSARARYRLQSYQMGLTESLNGKSDVRPKEPFVFGVPHEPTRQTEFTVGAFKVGLSKRARPMTIFSRQPGEIVMTPEDWRSIEKEAEDMIVTYHYLQWERGQLLRVAGEA